MSLDNHHTNYSTLILAFSAHYSNVHGWLSLFVCSFGLFFNTINIFILHKTKTPTSTTNFILILIASCDSIIMFFYIPFCVHFYILNENTYNKEPYPARDTLFWAWFLLLNILSSVTLHCISIWLTVYLAFYRYITLEKSISTVRRAGKKENSKIKTRTIDFCLSINRTMIILIMIFCILICIPVYMFPTVVSDAYSNQTLAVNNETLIMPLKIYYVDESQLNIDSGRLIFKVGLYFQAFFGKIIPCIFLIIFISLLIDILVFVKKNRARFGSIKRVLFNKKIIS